MTSAGVDVRAQRAGRTGAVVVLVDGTGERTMLPDRAAAGELSDVDPDWLDGVTWLHVPAYSLLSEPIGAASLELVAHVRRAGGTVSVDASSVSVIESYGTDRFGALLDDVRPDVVFANEPESALVPLDRAWVTIVKRGAGAVTVLGDPAAAEPYDVPVPAIGGVADTTGAGDAFAAGYIAASMAGVGIGDSVREGIRVAGAALTARARIRAPDRNSFMSRCTTPDVVHRDMNPKITADRYRAESGAATFTWRSGTATWPSGSGKGLQSPVRGFDSRRRLQLCCGESGRPASARRTAEVVLVSTDHVAEGPDGDIDVASFQRVNDGEVVGDRRVEVAVVLEVLDRSLRHQPPQRSPHRQHRPQQDAVVGRLGDELVELEVGGDEALGVLAGRRHGRRAAAQLGQLFVGTALGREFEDRGLDDPTGLDQLLDLTRVAP